MTIPTDNIHPNTLNTDRKPSFQHVLGSGRYELLEFVSKGGMGAVYRARDLELNRQVAIKCIIDIKRKDARILALTEARTLAALEHNNIMRIYDVLADGDQIWIVSEWIEGRSLADIQKPVPTEAVLAILTQLFDALSTAHAASVIHRDIKPANIMITPTGRVIVIDFGVAFAPGVSSGDTMAGSLRYTDPRILEGKKPDEWSDLFSASLLIFELLTGEVALPNLAPLPLYRHIKKHLKSRVEMLSDGLYPPLAKIAQSICHQPEEQPPLASVHAAKDVATLMNKMLMALCDETPERCIEKYLNNDKQLHEDVEKSFALQTSLKLKDNGISPRERTAWAAFRAFQDNDFSYGGIQETESTPLRENQDITVEKFSFIKSVSLIVGLFWLLYIPYLITHYDDVAQYATKMWRSLQTTKITYVKNEHRFVVPKDPLVLQTKISAPRDLKADPLPTKKRSEKIRVKQKPKAKSTELDKQTIPLNTVTAQSVLPLIESNLDLKPFEFSALVNPRKESTVPNTMGIPVNFIANAWAKLYVNDVEIGRLPAAQPFSLSAGKHKITLLNPYFETLEQTIAISTEMAKAPIRLTMVPLSGEYEIRLTKPALLTIDGQNYGLLSSKKIRLNYGRHFIEFKRGKTTYKPQNFFIGPKTDSVIWLDKPAEKKQPNPKAVLENPAND